MKCQTIADVIRETNRNSKLLAETVKVYQCTNANRLEKLEAFVMWIARDYIETSHDKVRLQRDDYIKRARELLNELYEEE